MDSNVSISSDTLIPSATKRGIPRDDSPPWSTHHLRVANTGLGQAPCPRQGCVPPSSDGTSVRTPSVVDLGHGLTDATSTIDLDPEDADIHFHPENVGFHVLSMVNIMSPEAQYGRSYIGSHDPISILKASGANLGGSVQSACEGTPSYYHAQVELDDDGEPASPRSSHLIGGVTMAVERLPQYPDLVHTENTEYSSRCATGTRGCAEVRVGCRGCIKRWRKNTEIRYNVWVESFPPELAHRVEDDMKTAISSWQGNGVRFKQVSRDSPATFAVRYEGEKYKDAYACSFFPDTGWFELFVYEKSLSVAEYLPNILAHEIGHILGLRHEFAHLDEWYNPSVLIGSEDDRSIMRYYRHVRQLKVSELDLQGLRKFYDYDQAEYGGFSIFDIEPELHDLRKANVSSHATRESAADARSELCPFALGRFFQRSLRFIKIILRRLSTYTNNRSLMSLWRSNAGVLPFRWFMSLLNHVQSLNYRV